MFSCLVCYEEINNITKLNTNCSCEYQLCVNCAKQLYACPICRKKVIPPAWLIYSKLFLVSIRLFSEISLITCIVLNLWYYTMGIPSAVHINKSNIIGCMSFTYLFYSIYIGDLARRIINRHL